MRFLCLHGKGTNSKVFQYQTAALRNRLGSDHVFEFIEGNIPCTPAEGIKDLPPNESFSYFREDDLGSYIRVLKEINDYLNENGPFDGVMAFSLGCMVAAGLVTYHQQFENVTHTVSSQLKCAIFFSAPMASEPGSRYEEGRQIDWFSYREMICVPTAHIWGASETDIPGECASPLRSICQKDLRSIFIHEGSHEIPGFRDERGLTGVVKCIQRTIDRIM